MKEMFTLEKVILSIVHDTRRPKKNNLYPVKYRIHHMQKQYYYPTGIDLTLEDFEKISKTKSAELKQLREIILADFDRIKEIIKPLVKSGDFTLEQLHIRLKGDIKNSIISAFMNKVETLKNAGKDGTAEWYYYALRSIQKFAEKDLKDAEITVPWLKK